MPVSGGMPPKSYVMLPMSDGTLPVLGRAHTMEKYVWCLSNIP